MGKTQNQEVKEWLTNTKISFSLISKSTGISRTTLYNYIDGKVDIRHNNYNKLSIFFSEEGNNMSIDAQYIIDLQKEKIERLEQKIKNESQSSSVYDGIHSDIVFSFEIKFNWSLKSPDVKVKYLSQDGNYIPLMAKKLGYTEREIIEILQIDEFVEYKNHKIHRLRTEDQKEEMLGIMDNFMKAYKTIKMNTTLLVAEIPVLYTHKNGAIFKANVEYRVNWIKGIGTAHIRWLKM